MEGYALRNKGGMCMQAARLTIFAGHYGSGKTTLAVGYALWLRQRHERVILCDLDIVNPYFRTADAEAPLRSQGIELIMPRFANTNVDAPALPARTAAIVDDRGAHAVVDLGGDDRGALALGRYASRIRAENAHEMLLVVNPFRPLTRSLEDLAQVRAEIEAAAKVPFTGLVHNANLGAETTLRAVADTLAFTEEAATLLGLPLKMTAIDSALCGEAADIPALRAIQARTEIFPIQRLSKSIWKI